MGPDVPPCTGLLRRALQGLRPEQGPAPAHAPDAAGLAVSRRRCMAADAVDAQQASLRLCMKTCTEQCLWRAQQAADAQQPACAFSQQSAGRGVTQRPRLAAALVQVLSASSGLHDAPAAQDHGCQAAVHGRQRHRRTGLRCGAPLQQKSCCSAVIKRISAVSPACCAQRSAGGSCASFRRKAAARCSGACHA